MDSLSVGSPDLHIPSMGTAFTSSAFPPRIPTTTYTQQRGGSASCQCPPLLPGARILPLQGSILSASRYLCERRGWTGCERRRKVQADILPAASGPHLAVSLPPTDQCYKCRESDSLFDHPSPLPWGLLSLLPAHSSLSVLGLHPHPGLLMGLEASGPPGLPPLGWSCCPG